MSRMPICPLPRSTPILNLNCPFWKWISTSVCFESPLVVGSTLKNPTFVNPLRRSKIWNNWFWEGGKCNRHLKSSIDVPMKLLSITGFLVSSICENSFADNSWPWVFWYSLTLMHLMTKLPFSSQFRQDFSWFSAEYWFATKDDWKVSYQSALICRSGNKIKKKIEILWMFVKNIFPSWWKFWSNSFKWARDHQKIWSQAKFGQKFSTKLSLPYLVRDAFLSFGQCCLKAW